MAEVSRSLLFGVGLREGSWSRGSRADQFGESGKTVCAPLPAMFHWRCKGSRRGRQPWFAHNALEDLRKAQRRDLFRAMSWTKRTAGGWLRLMFALPERVAGFDRAVKLKRRRLIVDTISWTLEGEALLHSHRRTSLFLSPSYGYPGVLISLTRPRTTRMSVTWDVFWALM